MLIDDISTVVVEPRCTAHITAGGNIRISVSDETAGAQQSLEKADPIQLAIFSHRCG
jgi:5-oxoprolinase (ATP-hydrolysing)